MGAITFLGCGNLATCILIGLLKADSKPETLLVERLFSEYLCCVRSQNSSRRILSSISTINVSPRPVAVTWKPADNVAAVAKAEVIILGCEKHACEELLGSEAMARALDKKLLISIVGGISPKELVSMVRYASSLRMTNVTVVKAIPNVSAATCDSMTIIQDQPPLSSGENATVQRIFNATGKFMLMPESLMDVAAVLGGSAPALAAVFLEGLIDGGVRRGLTRRDATTIAAQAVKGMVGMVESGVHPALLQERVSSPGGCTIHALSVLEEKALRGVVSRAVVEGTDMLRDMGKKDA